MSFGYKPTASRSRLMSASDKLDDDEEAIDQKVIRRFVQEEIRGVYYFGLRKCSLGDIKKGWPILYQYLVKNYGDFLNHCVCVVKKIDKLTIPKPYILLPDDDASVLTWNSEKNSPEFSQSEDMSRAIQRLK